ncbi:MAG TPA: WG repeat-containing protein, partial [Candidatus Binataceae bacterium]|nr:WG repeat-containing protein [Candidatus Binataceae bacterium]
VARVPAFNTSDFSEGLAAFGAEGKPGVRKFEPGNFVYRDYPGLKGFLDRNGRTVIKPQFANVGPFIGGLARAVLDGYCHIATWDGGREGTPTTGYPSDCGGAPADALLPCKVGFIDPRGNFAIEPHFEAAQDFGEKLAAVRIGGAWGFIDAGGRIVIPPRFEQVRSFREGLAAVKIDGRWGFVDKTGDLTIPAQFEEVDAFSDSLAVAYSGGKAFYVDRNGLTKIAGPFAEATPFVHGLAAVLLAEKHVAYMNHDGKIVFDYFRR